MTEAFAHQWQYAEVSGHREWIAVLLEKYYDPMYEYQLSKRDGGKLFCGDREAVITRAEQDH